MQRIIDGKRYNTETAEKLADLPAMEYSSDFRYHSTAIYRTKNGRFFIAGHGNAGSRWAQPTGSNGYGPGEGLRPLNDGEARLILEACGEDGMVALEKYLLIEDA
jgi:hypothetical protein